MAEPTTTFGLSIVYKLLGAAVGSSLAITILVPVHRRDAVVRFAFGVVLGVIFGPAAYHIIEPWIGDAGEAWNLLMGSTAAGFAAWSVASVVARAIQNWKGPTEVAVGEKPNDQK